MSKDNDKQHVRCTIARRVARELRDGDIVNLGIGLPSLVANEIDADIEVLFQSENGLLGIQGLANGHNVDPDLVNAGGQAISAIPGASYFNSADSFAIIRGGHVDVTVLGALQVDAQGNLANWIIPGKMVPGMGGAMDLVVGAKKVIVAMEHTAKGQPKILNHCSLPLTAAGQVNVIITEMAVFVVEPKGLVLTEISPHFTVSDIEAATEAPFTISPALKPMAA